MAKHKRRALPDKPLVVVTGPDKPLPVAWWATRIMLWLAGLRAFHVTPSTEKMPVGAAGIVLGGGQDIDPSHYGRLGDAGATYDSARDQLEMRVARAALQSDIPLLGICRGAQLINVVLGGTLHMDIRSQRKLTPNRNSIFPIKYVSIASGSKLHRALGTSRTKINSLHNQVVDRVADGMQIVAKDEDNFVQAIESCHNHFVLGVQWHPEYLILSSTQRALFADFAHHVLSHSRQLSI